MPAFQDIYNKYKNDTNILIYAINFTVADDLPEHTMSLIKQKNFTFPVVIGNDTLDEIFKLRSFPEVVMVKNNHALYRGNAECAEAVINEHLNKK